jgi:Lipocalin-like domain
MKFPLLAILLFVFGSAFSQTQTEKQVKDLLVHKWKLTHMEEGGQKIAVPAEFGDSFLDFNADGTITEIDSKSQEKGKWSYDHKTKTITSEVKKEVVKYEVIKITDTELVIKATIEDMVMNLYMKRV